MAQPKYTIYKYVRFKDGSWRYCRAALYANHTIKPDVVTVGGKEEKHPEGNYYIACGGNWIPAGIGDGLEKCRIGSQYRLFLIGSDNRPKLDSGHDAKAH